MLEGYKDGQPTLYSMLMNAINNGKLSHAYIFDSNGNSDVFDIVLSFVKMILCKDIDDENEKSVICKRIDDGNYLDVKVIEPDGMWIKKDQLLDLQSEFNKRSFEGTKKIYIIKNAERMNPQTSNSILKFLEEPVDDIIAILVVDNVNLLLSTIISRCQLIKLNKKNFDESSLVNFNNLIKNTELNTLSEEDRVKFIDDVFKFIMNIENNGLDTIVYAKILWHNNFKDRSTSLYALEIMIMFYYDVMKYLSGTKGLFFEDKIDGVQAISEKNDYISIAKKIEYIDEAKNNIKRNLNVNLLIDKLIIEMCGD